MLRNLSRTGYVFLAFIQEYGNILKLFLVRNGVTLFGRSGTASTLKFRDYNPPATASVLCCFRTYDSFDFPIKTYLHPMIVTFRGAPCQLAHFPAAYSGFEIEFPGAGCSGNETMYNQLKFENTKILRSFQMYARC